MTIKGLTPGLAATRDTNAAANQACRGRNRQKGEEKMETVSIEIAVIEAGPGYTDRLEVFTAALSGTELQMVEQAQELVSNCGYRVMSDAEGGCCEYVGVTGGSDYIAVTVWPK